MKTSYQNSNRFLDTECNMTMMVYFILQGSHIHCSVQYPLIHECQTLAMDEGLLQDQASSEEC